MEEPFITDSKPPPSTVHTAEQADHAAKVTPFQTLVFGLAVFSSWLVLYMSMRAVDDLSAVAGSIAVAWYGRKAWRWLRRQPFWTGLTTGILLMFLCAAYLEKPQQNHSGNTTLTETSGHEP